MNGESHLYEYAVVRYVPAIEREEFINIGLIMMCKRQRWLKSRMHLPMEKIMLFRSELPVEALCRQIDEISMIAEARLEGGPIAELPVEERFRWLSAAKSACIQTSRPHPGITDNLEDTFEAIFSEQVL